MFAEFKGRWVAIFADAFERLALVLLCAPFVLALAATLPSHPWWILIAISETLAVVLILTRRPGNMALAPYPFIIGFAGTALPLFIRPAEGGALIPAAVSTTLMMAGLALNIAAKLFLNRSFGVVAANRGVKRGGPYRLVRHPMYLGYFATQLGFLLSSFSIQNLVLYLIAWTLQLLRILEEERFLSVDPAYRAYQSKVRYRLIPGLV
jgi:protein-S-isoprenylcysteine O-methyltransferase Ste14